MAANVNNYINAANAAIRNNVQMRKTLADNKARLGDIAGEGVRQDAKNRVADAENNLELAKEKMRQEASDEVFDQNMKTAEEIQGIKKRTRMTGAIASGVGLAGTAYFMSKQKKEENPLLGQLQQMQDFWTKQMSSSRTTQADIDEQITELDGRIKANADKKPETMTIEPGPVQTIPKGGMTTGMRLMEDLVSSGIKPVSAASLVGNSMTETGNFRFNEELEPNSYGTKGLGYLMWTGSRRKDFEDWTKSQGLDPRSHEANVGFLKHELEGGQHWSGGSDFDRFKSIPNVKAATSYFMHNYLRPNENSLHLDRRQSNAQQVLDAYLKQNQ